MLSKISAFILKLLGWEIVGQWPDVKKFVLIVIPHTSNWDFPYGILIRSAMKRDIKYAAKDSLFKSPLGRFFYWTGGVPVDRSKNNNFVDAVVQIFNEREEFALCMSPEGTRQKVDKLKTGFYYIAKGAKAPIVMLQYNFGIRKFVVSEPFYTTDDKEADFAFIYDFFRGVKGFNPKNQWTHPDDRVPQS
ncbi:MAG: 1-acyl-sn-glycerol-3-phosphate acyltransferase [Bacteroidota bacterium]